MNDGEYDVSDGKVADRPDIIERIFPEGVLNKFEIVSYRNAATILQSGFPQQHEHIVNALENIQISTMMIRACGQSP